MVEKQNKNLTRTTLLPTYTRHKLENGSTYLMPKGFPIDGFESGLRYVARENDVFVATYPKCGTTWMQSIVYLILRNGEPITSDIKLSSIFPHLEEVGKEFVANVAAMTNDSNYRLIKTHLPFDLTPFSEKSKYIYVTRNPKDCCVSFFHHTRGFPKHYDFASGKFEEYFELFLDGNVDFGDYFQNLSSWLPHKSRNNILFMSYEDLKSNPRNGILQVAKFLGETHYTKMFANDERILKDVLLHSSVSSMQKDPQRWSSARSPDQTPFVRKGTVGDWKNYFTKDQSDRMNKKIRESFAEDELNGLWTNELVLSYE